ncbi:hypothetical protein CHU95_20715 [Niveispirillum lacus]|uniref:Uncharacterized protein n=1 Tax=Niveispirillum lacus TaxID=1981099 RepID=A0A255YQR9_9PROT|nr:hypothetical protein [Niveispirillum lacus]OYQ31567.1 hypothetical protein CHU95_20715 [Niveispirillum lacus]
MQALFHLPTIPAAIPTRNPAFTGQVTLAGGSSTAPAIGFSSDPDTGVYQPSAGVLGLTADGTEITRATASAISLGGVPGAESLRATLVPNAVNRVDIRGSVTGASPTIQAQGNDADINLTLMPKGNGVVTGTGGVLKLAAVTEGQGIAGYAGGIMVWGITRLVNGPKIAAFGDAYVATGASSGAASGTVQLTIAHTAMASQSVSITGAVTGAAPRIGTTGGALAFAPAVPAVLFPASGSAPAVTTDGAVYFDTTMAKLRIRAAGTWVDLH